MRFLLDTNIVSAYLKGDRRVFNHVVQHGGALSTSVICAGELYSWAYRAKTNPGHLRALQEFLSGIHLLPVDHEVGRKFGGGSRGIAGSRAADS